MKFDLHWWRNDTIYPKYLWERYFFIIDSLPGLNRLSGAFWWCLLRWIESRQYQFIQHCGRPILRLRPSEGERFLLWVTYKTKCAWWFHWDRGRRSPLFNKLWMNVISNYWVWSWKMNCLSNHSIFYSSVIYCGQVSYCYLTDHFLLTVNFNTPLAIWRQEEV